MKIVIDLVIRCPGDRQAASLMAALTPDNHRLPKGQTISSERDGSVLRFEISSPAASNGVSSALSLLADTKLFADVWTTAS